MKEFAKDLLEDPAYRQSLKGRIMAGKAPGVELLFYHYVYGKPSETNRPEESQAKFADLVGVAPNTVARWERGELGLRPTSARLIQFVAAAAKPKLRSSQGRHSVKTPRPRARPRGRR